MSAGIELRPVREDPSEDSPAAPPKESPRNPLQETAARGETAAREPHPEPEARRSYGRTAVVLGIALVLVLGTWVLSEVERGREIVSLESRIVTLEEELSHKDAALAAQEQRIQDVRDHVDALRQLLDAPLATAR